MFNQKAPEDIHETAERYKRKNEGYYIRGPYYLDEDNYWVIHYLRKRFLKDRGAGLIVIDRDGNLVREWEIYSKISKVYLTPKISQKFIEIYEEEYNQLDIMKNYMISVIEGKGDFDINELYEDAKEYEINELVNAIVAVKTDIENIISILVDMLSKWTKDRVILNNLLKRYEYKLLDEFSEDIITNGIKILEDLDKELNRHSKMMIHLTDLIRKFGMGGEYSKEIIISIGRYIHSIKKFKRNIRKMLKLRKHVDFMTGERVIKIKKYYAECINRIDTL